MQIVAIITYNLVFLIITFALVDEIINSNLILIKSTNKIDNKKTHLQQYTTIIPK